jgi:hypothetical protein
MDIYTYLKKDHRMVKDLMEKTMASSNASDREELFDEIREELELHSETEQKTFYKAIKEKGSKHLQEKEGHAEEEHDEIKNLLRDLGKISVDSDEWLILFGELKHAVEHHVHEEEGEIFQDAKKVLSDKRAKELAVEMEEMKELKKNGILSAVLNAERERGIF